MTDRTHVVGDYSEAALDHGGRSAWGAIFAGAIVAMALMALLSLLGMAVGFSSVDPATDTDPLRGVPTTSLIWAVISSVLALGAGGFVAGRLAGVLHRTGSILHGTTVWGLALLAGIWLGAMAGGGLINLTGAMLSKASSALATAAGAVVPDDFELSDIMNLNMNDLPDAVRSRLESQGITPQNLRTELRESFRRVVSQREQSRARELAAETAAEILRSPATAREEIADFTDAIFGQGGVLSQEDLQEAQQVVQDRFGLSPGEADALVNEVQATAQRYQEQASQALQTAQEEALQAAGAASDALASAAWGAFAAGVLGLLAAVGGAVAGRPKMAMAAR